MNVNNSICLLSAEWLADLDDDLYIPIYIYKCICVWCVCVCACIAFSVKQGWALFFCLFWSFLLLATREEVPAQIMTIKIEPKIIYRPKRRRVCVCVWISAHVRVLFMFWAAIWTLCYQSLFKWKFHLHILGYLTSERRDLILQCGAKVCNHMFVF